MAEDGTPALLVDATYRLEIGDAEAFRALASRMASVAAKEDGCSFMKVTQDIGDATTFRLFEGWRDRAALDAHLASEDVQAILREAGRLRISERVIDTYDVSGRQPLDMPS